MSQVCASDMRTDGPSTPTLFRATTRPATTVPTRPDAPISSVGRNAANGMASESTVFDVGWWTNRRRNIAP